MSGTEIVPGLWRWTAPHPEWEPTEDPDSPDAWPRDVGCVLAHVGEHAVLIDPLIEDEARWEWLAQRIGGRPAHVLTTISYHRRSRDAALERFGADREPPTGVEPFGLRGAAETVFWIRQHAALVTGDRLLGDERGGLRMCPQSWLALPVAQLAERLRPLLDLPVERVLVSHGEPVLRNGREALRQALADGP